MAESRVLVVDDDEAVRGLVGAALERVGVAVTVAADGHDALRKLAAAPVDLVVLDWHMPGLSGLEVLEAIGNDHPDVPVVICTGAGDAERDVALAAGAIDHFTKDRPLAEFVRHVQAILAGDFEPAQPADRRPGGGTGASAMREEVGRIAHQLHNHLTVVLGHSDLARTQVERAGEFARSEQVIEDLQAVAAAAERISELARRLQELAERGAVPASAPEPESRAVADRSGAARILLLEDDLDLRMTTERLLEDEGYRVLAAADVGTALALLRDDGPFDLCITDLLIPGVRPGEAAAMVAAAAPGTPLLVMSGYGYETVDSSLAPPTAGFLAKPFTRDRLLDAIRGALRS